MLTPREQQWANRKKDSQPFILSLRILIKKKQIRPFSRTSVLLFAVECLNADSFSHLLEIARSQLETRVRSFLGM